MCESPSFRSCWTAHTLQSPVDGGESGDRRRGEEGRRGRREGDRGGGGEEGGDGEGGGRRGEEGEGRKEIRVRKKWKI